MTDDRLPASLVVAIAVLGYGLGVLSLSLLHQHARRPTSGEGTSRRLRNDPSRRSSSSGAAVRLVVSMVLWAIVMTSAWAVLS
jgi:hypothetical protein